MREYVYGEAIVPDDLRSRVVYPSANHPAVRTLAIEDGRFVARWYFDEEALGR